MVGDVTMETNVRSLRQLNSSESINIFGWHRFNIVVFTILFF
jgi:hypothetical protein